MVMMKPDGYVNTRVQNEMSYWAQIENEGIRERERENEGERERRTERERIEYNRFICECDCLYWMCVLIINIKLSSS